MDLNPKNWGCGLDGTVENGGWEIWGKSEESSCLRDQGVRSSSAVAALRRGCRRLVKKRRALKDHRGKQATREMFGPKLKSKKSFPPISI